MLCLPKGDKNEQGVINEHFLCVGNWKGEQLDGVVFLKRNQVEENDHGTTPQSSHKKSKNTE
jgi:hypothetical protein